MKKKKLITQMKFNISFEKPVSFNYEKQTIFSDWCFLEKTIFSLYSNEKIAIIFIWKINLF